MESLLVRLMFLAALIELGISFSDGPHTYEKRSRDVLRVDWKPISVFPEEWRKFR